MPPDPPDPPDPRFDLCARPTFPVHSPAGPALVGLRELLLRADEFIGLAVGLPPAASGLMRILYAIAARLTGLDTCDDGRAWHRRRAALLSQPTGFAVDAVDAYLALHRSRLFLFGPNAFLQDARLREQSPSRSGINKLVMARSAGNNPVFFGHFTDDRPVPLPPQEALLHLVAQLYYGPSGQCTSRVVDGQRYGNAMGGPLRRTLSFHPQGRTLYESLLLGIPAPEHWPSSDAAGQPDGCPWERAEPSSPLAAPQPPAGPLSLLTERYQHAILLYPDERGEAVTDATITWALRTKRPETVKDPYLIWDETKDGELRPRDASAERALWRDLDALVLLHRTEPPGRRPPIVDGLAGRVPAAIRRELRMAAYGFDQDGQTRDRSYFTAATPPVLGDLLASRAEEDTALANAARDARVAAEKAADSLRYALRVAWRAYTLPFRDDKPARTAHTAGSGKSASKGDGPWPEEAYARYWPRAEETFWRSLRAGDFAQPLREFGHLALEAYDAVTLPVAATPRGAKAREEARGLIRSLCRPTA